MTAARPRLLRGADSAAARHGSSHRPRTRRAQSVARQGGRHLGIAADDASPSADQDGQPRVTAGPVVGEKRTPWCSVMIIRRLAGTCRTGHTARTVASTSRHPVVAVPCGRRRRADDRGQIGGEHTSSQLPPARHPRQGAPATSRRIVYSRWLCQPITHEMPRARPASTVACHADSQGPAAGA
jgi:hypothetical protein